MLIFAMPSNEAMAANIARTIDGQPGVLETRRFPDGESWLRYASDPGGHDIAIVCTLDRPDTKFLPLLFAARTARELGARRVGLVAPYLAYMRQDQRFRPGEAVTSRCLAREICGAFDWLVTIDPHLHRQHSLSAIYAIPARAGHAAPLMAAWMAKHVQNPILIGPDRESEQWVCAIAETAKTPFVILKKIRRGDREVEIQLPNDNELQGRTPVIVDDIVASGQTMLETVRLIVKKHPARPVCIAVHGIFADRSDEKLAAEGATVVTSNTISHATNAVDVTSVIVSCIAELQPPEIPLCAS